MKKMQADDYDAATQHLARILTPETLGAVGAIFAFRFPDGSATLDASSSHGLGFVADEPESLGLVPDFEVTISRADFANLVFGRLHPMGGMATGRMKLKGDFKQAIKLDRLLKS
jgi:hypothetical protein